MTDWTKCTPETLPEPFVSVQCYIPSQAPLPTVREGHLRNDGSWSIHVMPWKECEVVEWKPMSEPPKED